MIVTKENLDELLRQGMSLRGAWNSAQIKALCKNEVFFGGFPQSGWKGRLIGQNITQAQIDEFLRLKDKHLAHKSRDIPGQRTLESEIYSHIRSIHDEIKQAKTA